MELPAGIPETHRSYFEALVDLAAPTASLTYDEMNDGLPDEVGTTEEIDTWIAGLMAYGIGLLEARPPDVDAVLRADVACRRMVYAAFADPAGRELLLALPGWLDDTWEPAPLGLQQVTKVVPDDDATPRDLFDGGDVEAAMRQAFVYVRARPGVAHARLVAAGVTPAARTAIDAAYQDFVAARAALPASVRPQVDAVVDSFRDYNLTAAELAELADDALARAATSFSAGRSYGFWELAHWLVDKAIYRAVRQRAETDGTLDEIQPRLSARPRIPVPGRS